MGRGDSAVCPRGIGEAGAGSRSSDSLAFTRRNSFTRRDLRRPRLLPNGHQEAHLSAMSREIIAHTVVQSNTFDRSWYFFYRKNQLTSSSSSSRNPLFFFLLFDYL